MDGVTYPAHHLPVSHLAALLGNYNVFPGTVDDARSEDILNALDAAYADGMDVANMSLGGDAAGVQDLLTHAVDNLDRAPPYSSAAQPANTRAPVSFPSREESGVGLWPAKSTFGLFLLAAFILLVSGTEALVRLSGARTLPNRSWGCDSGCRRCERSIPTDSSPS